MTDLDYILARLQLERETPMARWNVPGPRRDRVQPRTPRQLLTEDTDRPQPVWTPTHRKAAA